MTGASGVEFGLRDPSGFYTACSGSNGNFWVMGTQKVDFSKAVIRMRTAKGESIMKSTGSAGCNSCHMNNKIIQP
jgi:hypothetical protein